MKVEKSLIRLVDDPQLCEIAIPRNKIQNHCFKLEKLAEMNEI